MNQGARVASADVLCFVHADTHISESVAQRFALETKQGRWGRFDVFFFDNVHPTRWTLRVVQRMINLRSRLSGIATGDQALFIQRDLFWQVGGYRDLPIMEDVDLCKRLKAVTRPYCSALKIGTSARRWQQAGVWRTILLMWFLRASFSLGVSAERLHKWYRNAPR